MPWGRFSQVLKRYPLPFRLHGHDHLGEIFTVRLTCPPKIGPVIMLRVGLEFRMRRQGGRRKGIRRHKLSVSFGRLKFFSARGRRLGK